MDTKSFNFGKTKECAAFLKAVELKVGAMREHCGEPQIDATPLTSLKTGLRR